MPSWYTLWNLAALFAINGSFGAGYTFRRIQMPTVQVDCFDFPMKTASMKLKEDETRLMTKLRNQPPIVAPSTAYDTALNLNEIPRLRRRYDLFPNSEDIAREHAKLVQDINSLRQVVYFSPWSEETKDYEDTIYQEILEPGTTTTHKPTTTTPAIRTTKSSGIPILYFGGASQKQVIKTQPVLKLPRPISLVGSSVTPQLTKHPYPFVGLAANSLQRPAKLCMSPTMPLMTYASTRRPTLWERFISFLNR